jgi:chemotaxis family two-component system response regulator Rcp1
MFDEPLRILLVDDDEDCRLMVRDAIAECRERNEIFEARDGREAIEFLRKARSDPSVPRPGLIYLDLEMPGGMDGQAVLKAIRSDPELRDIPVVMMTGVSDEDQMRQAALNGANSYTIKPADAGQFLKTVAASANYWLTIHQYPTRHLPEEACRR